MPAPEPQNPRFLTVQQAAEMLNVSVALVYQLVSKREIEHLRIGINRGTIRIPEEEIDRYKKGRER
jgi:excisionase family DNA binding protein